MLVRIGMALLVVSLGLNGLLAWKGRGAELSTRRTGVGQEPPAPPSGAPSNEIPRGCEQQRQALVASVIAETARLNQVSPANVLFQSNPANDVARARLAPIVEQALGGVGCAHVLECKDFVCRIVIPGGDPASEACLGRLQGARPLWAYTQDRLLFKAGPWVKDPLTGIAGYRREVYIRLANADGAPIEESGGER